MQGKKAPVRSMANDPAELFGLQGQFGDEAELNAAMATRAGAAPNEIQGLDRISNMFKRGQQQTYAGMQPTPYLEEQTSAINEGFGGGGSMDTFPGGSPTPPGQITSGLNPIQQRNVYKRQFEQEKMRQPIQQQQMQEAGATQRAKIGAESAKYRADTDYDMATDRATQYNELAAMMRATGQVPNRLTLPGRTSGGSIGMAPTAKPVDQRGMMSQIAVAAGNLEKEGRDPWESFGNPRSQSEAEFNSMVNSVLATTDFGPGGGDAKQTIAGFLRDPQRNRLPLEQLFNSPWDETVPLEDRATQQEWNALVDFFTKVRGY